MMMDDKKLQRGKIHNILIENRSKMTINGVDDVESFDDNNIVLLIDEDILIIRGVGLKINKINTETGEVLIEGDIFSLDYGEQPKKGIFSRLFK